MSITIFILGLCVGSFLNVVIFRIHEGRNFIKGRSKCLKCGNELEWYDNIPLLSYIFLKGKCRHCGIKISAQYPAVEFGTGILFLISFIVWTDKKLNFPVSPFIKWGAYGLLLSYLIFTSILIVIFVYDLRWYLILDKISIPSIIIAFSLNLFLGFSVWNLLSAAIAISGFFLFQFLISKGKWIGGGDIRLGFLMGAMLGMPKAILALFIAYIAGSVIGISLIIFGKKKMESCVPFGAFLAPATYAVMLWGGDILRWYAGFLK
ncbi:MAG: prepilin peptidase [bacterium]